ncbi:acyl-CoA dehydrogenase family protein [Kineococcus sp. GCM10028916]|uniref:acyl-CoA dehydrogenase family protein n=1 Tax=Kineococcus sp. GCM10028916 TaxID=3273394 RepID=UPI00362D08F6
MNDTLPAARDHLVAAAHDHLVAAAHDHLVEAARDLVPALRAGAPAAERGHRLTPGDARFLHEAGFFALHAPAALGGLGASIATAVDVHAELARGSGSAAWCAVILSGAGLLASRFPAAGREELWADDPRAGVCGSFFPTGTGRRVPGGLRVSGRWQPMSGVHHARWALLPVLVQDVQDERPAVEAVLVPVEALDVEPTWDVVGMAGTGSDTAVAQDVLVPQRRCAPFGALLGAGAPDADDPLRSTTAYSAVGVCAGAVLVGMARAGLELVLDALGEGRPLASSTYADARDAPGVRFDVASAARLVDTAGLHLARATGEVERGAREGRQLDVATRARVRADLATITVSTRAALGHLLDAGGARSFAAGNPLQAVWRDVEVLSRHPLLAPGLNVDVYARTLLGSQEQVAAFV